jgi:hypothetical protein
VGRGEVFYTFSCAATVPTMNETGTVDRLECWDEPSGCLSRSEEMCVCACWAGRMLAAAKRGIEGEGNVDITSWCEAVWCCRLVIWYGRLREDVIISQAKSLLCQEIRA